MRFRFFFIAALVVCPAFAQLSTDQRVQDFRSLASLFVKQYAPYEWKRDMMGADLYQLGPWISRVQQAKDDIEFYEIMKQYVASLQDAHSTYLVPSTFEAYLGFDVDIYDGKVLIDFVDRFSLPARQFPFAEGDELVSVDGVNAGDLIQGWWSLDSLASDRPTRRYLADLLTYRNQVLFPRAALVGDSSKVVIQRQGGALESYNVPWQTYGRRTTLDGPVPSPFETRAALSGTPRGQALSARPRRGRVVVEEAELTAARALGERPAPRVRAAAAAATVDSGPFIRRRANAVRTFKVSPERFVHGVGLRTPYYTLPSGFVVRLGRSSADAFYTGVYTSGTTKIGLIRIPDFDPAVGSVSALRQFQTEIAYMKTNTDALVIDVTRNPGGDGCLANDLLASLAGRRIDIFGEEVRPTLFWVNWMDQNVTDAIDYGYEQWEIDLLTAIQKDIESAFKENRGRTGPEGLCTLSLTEEPFTDRNGVTLNYNKPMMLLTDEFSSSAAEIFAAGFQDNKLGPLFGFRTTGAGGAILTTMYPTGFYSEGESSVTISLLVRARQVSVQGFPPTRYIENVGVHPDVPYDYMSTANLSGKGKPFTDAFTAAIVAQTQPAKP
jgi:C-terminal processing protease CtpA/Prc